MEDLLALGAVALLTAGFLAVLYAVNSRKKPRNRWIAAGITVVALGLIVVMIMQIVHVRKAEAERVGAEHGADISRIADELKLQGFEAPHDRTLTDPALYRFDGKRFSSGSVFVVRQNGIGKQIQVEFLLDPAGVRIGCSGADEFEAPTYHTHVRGCNI